MSQSKKPRMPRFAYEYLQGGCIDEHGLDRNNQELVQVRLRSELLQPSVKREYLG